MTDYPFFAPEIVADPYPLFDRLREEDPVYADQLRLLVRVALRRRQPDAARPAPSAPGRGVPDSMGITSGAAVRPHDDLDDGASTAPSTPGCAGSSRARSRRARRARCGPASRRSPTALLDADRWRAAEPTSSPSTRSRSHGGGAPALRCRRRASGRRTSRALFDPAPPDAHAGPLGPMGALADWFVGVVDARRRSAPGDDMFSAMVGPDENGDALSTEELVANAVLLVTAGFETTMSLITLAVFALLTHPDQPELLRADPSLARNAVEETLRFEPAALSTTRVHTGRPRGRRRNDPRWVQHPVLGRRRQPRSASLRRTPVVSTSRVTTSAHSRSAPVCTRASAPRSRGSKARSRVADRCSRAFPQLAAPSPIRSRWQTENPTVRRPVALHVEFCTRSACGAVR